MAPEGDTEHLARFALVPRGATEERHDALDHRIVLGDVGDEDHTASIVQRRKPGEHLVPLLQTLHVGHRFSDLCLLRPIRRRDP